MPAFGCSANLFSPARAREGGRLRIRHFRFALAVSLLLAVVSNAQGQDPDSLGVDSAGPPVDYTAEFLEAAELSEQRVPITPLLGPGSPQPALSRWVFTRDSLEWSGAGTLADLLTQIPGVFVWRGGWVAQPEMANYRGRGATSVRYVLDDQDYQPIGADSVGVDPSVFVLGLLDRVEIERWPDGLVVYLHTRRHDRLAPASRLAAGTGDRSIARYQGTFEKRWRSGIGLGLGGDFLNLPTGRFEVGDRLQTQFWAQLSYVPSARAGLQYQLFGTDINRDPVRRVAGDTVGLGLDGSRTDHQLKFFWRKRPDGTGLAVDARVGRSTWNGSGINQASSHYSLRLGQRSPKASWSTQVGGMSLWTPLAVRAEGGWAPTASLSASAEAVYQQHDGDRTSTWLGLRAGVGLPLGIALTASGRVGRQVVAPSIARDTAQDLNNVDVTLALRRSAVELAVGVAHTSEFSPATFQPYLVVDTLRAFGPTEWAQFTGRLRLAPWLTVDGWFSNAMGDTPDGQPTTHGFARAALRSKFLRVFPSGAFDLKLQLTLETWAGGTLGVDSTGATVPLPAATFMVGFLQLEIGSFRAFYERRNLLGTPAEYVPGFEIPAFATVFGVRWDFLN